MKKVMKYMMVLLAVATVGLSVQAWANPVPAEAVAVAADAAESAMAEDIDLGESLMNFAKQSGIGGIIADWRVLVMLWI